MRLVPIEDSFEASLERYRPNTRPNSTQSDMIHSQSDTGCVETKAPRVFATLTADEARAAAAAEELKLMPQRPTQVPSSSDETSFKGVRKDKPSKKFEDGGKDQGQ